jgi:tRNA (guanine37-N1)-methyltransferase
MLRFDIITIFPNMFPPVLNDSILKRGQERKKISVHVHDLRDYSPDKKRRSVDDRPFGGGAGMILSPEPLFEAVKKIKGRRQAHVIYTAPAGQLYTQAHAKRLTKHKNLIIICGHYEGIDERVRTQLVDEEISIGDYVLTGGEIPAMVIVDSVARLVPGVVGKEESLKYESFEDNLLEGPHYTRPADFRGLKVPDVLLSGNHKAILAWRKEQALAVTKKTRPDLIQLNKKSLGG